MEGIQEEALARCVAIFIAVQPWLINNLNQDSTDGDDDVEIHVNSRTRDVLEYEAILPLFKWIM